MTHAPERPPERYVVVTAQAGAADTFMLTINVGADAFTPSPVPEIQRLLHQVAAKLNDWPAVVEGILRDSNGNTCGLWGFEPDNERREHPSGGPDGAGTDRG